MQTAIPCLFMRGGTSRGPFFLETDLPSDVASRDRVLLAALGSPDQPADRRPRRRQSADEQGGHRPPQHGTWRRSRLSLRSGDGRHGALVDTTPNCGNMLAAVVPFALEVGLVQAAGATRRRCACSRSIRTCSATSRCRRPGGRVEYEGDARIDGVPGTAAPIAINFLDTAGSVCSGLLPTGHVRDRIDVVGAGVRSVLDRRHLHRQRHAAGDDAGERPGPHRLRERRRAECRRGAQGSPRGACG